MKNRFELGLTLRTSLWGFASATTHQAVQWAAGWLLHHTPVTRLPRLFLGVGPPPSCSSSCPVAPAHFRHVLASRPDQQQAASCPATPIARRAACWAARRCATVRCGHIFQREPRIAAPLAAMPLPCRQQAGRAPVPTGHASGPPTWDGIRSNYYSWRCLRRHHQK